VTTMNDTERLERVLVLLRILLEPPSFGRWDPSQSVWTVAQRAAYELLRCEVGLSDRPHPLAKA
jgi:hypothetical protein